jgi:MSHA pilin protein MshA
MMLKAKKAFTLIELIMVIIVMGILAMIAIPRFVDLASQAKAAAEKGTVAGITSGITVYFAQHTTFPSKLDNLAGGTACSTAHACFTNILGQGGVTSDWIKNSDVSYTGPTGTIYTYNSINGSFQ